MLRGRLVYLRPAERTDIPIFVRWLSDARTTENLALRSPLSIALEERWFEDLLDHHGRDRWHFVICLLADGRPVGSLDLHEIDYTNGGAGLGIQIGDPADRGQGYGGDALGVLIDFAFDRLRLERVWLDVYDGTRVPAGCTSASGSSTRRRSATASTGPAATTTSTGWRSSGPSGRSGGVGADRLAGARLNDPRAARGGRGPSAAGPRPRSPARSRRPAGRRGSSLRPERRTDPLAAARTSRSSPSRRRSGSGSRNRTHRSRPRSRAADEHRVDRPRGDERRLVDRRQLVARRPGLAPRSARRGRVRHPAR